MAVGPEEYRAAARRFASGVTIVTVRSGARVHGMTASSFAAVSLHPPLVLACLEKQTVTRSLVLQARSFVVNVLGAQQEELARRFAVAGPKPFDDFAHHPSDRGHPIIDGAIAWFDCTTIDVVEAGDHDIVVAEVVACAAEDAPPLIYFDRAYRALTDG